MPATRVAHAQSRLASNGSSMTGTKKYPISLCGICRDEDRYIPEWIAYHLAIGFDHIFLFDNMSVNSPKRVIRYPHLTEKVTIVRWPSVPGQNAQQIAYNHFLETYRDQVEWALVLDLDEFLNLKQDDHVADFLKRFPSAAGVAINWRMFGSSGEIHFRRRPLMMRFTRASEIAFDANKLVKTFFRLDKTTEIFVHHGHYSDGGVLFSPNGDAIANGYHLAQSADNFAVAQINHYFLKSKDEWTLKLLRGYADSTVRPPDTFDLYDRNEIADVSILRHRRRFTRMLRRVARPRPLGIRIVSAFKMISQYLARQAGTKAGR